VDLNSISKPENIMYIIYQKNIPHTPSLREAPSRGESEKEDGGKIDD